MYHNKFMAFRANAEIRQKIEKLHALDPNFSFSDIIRIAIVKYYNSMFENFKTIKGGIEFDGERNRQNQCEVRIDGAGFTDYEK